MARTSKNTMISTNAKTGIAAAILPATKTIRPHFLISG
jgi:hypothetical protein